MTVTLVVSVWFVIACNAAFWRMALRAQDGLRLDNAAFLLSLFVLATLLVNLLLTPFVWRRVAKPILGFFLLATSVAAYFMNRLGVMIDTAMIHNTFETDTREVAELLTAPMLVYVALLGAVPLAWLCWTKIEYRVWWKELAQKAAVLAATLLATAGIALGFYAEHASLLRNHRELRYLLAPINVVAGVQGTVADRLRKPRQLIRVGEDARVAPSRPPSPRPVVLILVVGETARTASFSLAGYDRPTNPELALKGVTLFSDVRSCGTSTATALPCMFSDLGRQSFRAGAARNREGLLDVLQRGGFRVLWRDNDSGCKGACDRVEVENLAALSEPGLCRDGECWDEILLAGLPERLDQVSGDAVIVLHQKGSHGPAYYRRYPDRFKVFVPACETNEIGRCTQEEIRNAYDNSILYTDAVLALAIEALERRATRIDAALLYVSDHGESLGEKGVYLHAIPYLIAPIEQRRVPLIAWFSASFRQRFAVDTACLDARRATRYSHDSLFHSVLGLLRVETTAYRPALDLFRPCTAEKKRTAKRLAK